MRYVPILLSLFIFSFANIPSTLVESLASVSSPTVAVVGGGISGLVVAYVLQKSGQYEVELFEAQPQLGGHIRSLTNPLDESEQLNIGHATHMGMFYNLRLMLKHFGIPEWKVGRGANSKPGIFRMISVSGTTGETFQPPLKHITSPSIWWEAFRFYFYSYLNADKRLDVFLKEKHFSKRFLDILYWAMATFEFDKEKDEMGEYALGAARALLITQVFFKYLLCDAFEGSLPAKVDNGLKDDLASRIMSLPDMSTSEKKSLVESFREITNDSPLASYFTSSYGSLVSKLAEGAGRIHTNVAVERVSKKDGKLTIDSSAGESMEADFVVFTTHPSIARRCLNEDDFPLHSSTLGHFESGAVGVRIVHAKDLPFDYPPTAHDTFFERDTPPPVLGIFDISELTTSTEASGALTQQAPSETNKAGWLSVAYPVYKNTTLNRHQQLLETIPCANFTVYPWTKATSSFPMTRREIVKLQGADCIYLTGQSLTGVNKASELQVTNALKLCRDYFGVVPPWKAFAPCPLLPDCNDVDAFYTTKSPLQASLLAIKSLIGSFLLTSAVATLGVEFFD